MEDRWGENPQLGASLVVEAPANALPPLCGALPAGWQDMPVPQQLAVPPPASTGGPSVSVSSSSGCMMGLHAPGGPLSLDTLAASLSESLLPSALLAHASASDGKTSNSSKSSSSGSTAPGEVVGGVSIEQCPPAPQLQSHWAPAADPILAYGTGHPASSALQLQQQQQKSDSKGRAHRQRQQQQEEDVPRQYATSTAFFAGVSPIATEAGLLSVFEQFGTVIRVNLFRPYKTSKTSKGCGLVVFSKPSEAAHAMETLSGRFVWPGARSPIILEWGNCSRPQPPQKQQQQAVARPPPPPPAAAAPGLVGKAASSLSPQHLMPAGGLMSNALVHPTTQGQPGQLLRAPLMQAPQQFQQQPQIQQQAVLLVPQGISLPQGYAPSTIQVAGGTAGQLVVLARY